jgi:hypothetical protein
MTATRQDTLPQRCARRRAETGLRIGWPGRQPLSPWVPRIGPQFVRGAFAKGPEVSQALSNQKVTSHPPNELETANRKPGAVRPALGTGSLIKRASFVTMALRLRMTIPVAAQRHRDYRWEQRAVDTRLSMQAEFGMPGASSLRNRLDRPMRSRTSWSLA